MTAELVTRSVEKLQLPKGFRFHPTDEELVQHYLCPKAESQSFSVQIIADVDIYKFDPWNLPEKAVHGESEWYFFSPRDRKYPNGSRPNRAAGSGYWKATGTDKHISCIVDSDGAHQLRKMGVKKALVFYKGRAPNGTKTNWIMHEYRLAEGARGTSTPSSAAKRVHRKGSLRLDDWVLCRIYKKKSVSENSSQASDPKQDRDEVERPERRQEYSSAAMEDFLAFLPEIETSKFNQLQMLPRIDDNVNSEILSAVALMDQDLQSTGSVVMDYNPHEEFEDTSYRGQSNLRYM